MKRGRQKRFRLEVICGDKAETVFDGRADKPVSIGRSESNAVVLRDPTVSKFHAVIEEGPEGLRIRDTASLGGTKRGGKKVSAHGILLTSGDRLRLGKTHLRFLILGAKPPRPPQLPAVAVEESQVAIARRDAWRTLITFQQTVERVVADHLAAGHSVYELDAAGRVVKVQASAVHARS